MIQPVRGRNQQVGCFLRGASAFAAERTVTAIARFITGIIFAAYNRSTAGIRDAVADSPTASAMRQFLGSKSLSAKLAHLLDWKISETISKALRRKRNRKGYIVLAIDSTCKSTLSRLSRWLFSLGKGQNSGSHIFVCGVLLLPDGSRIPVRPRQKKGKARGTQVDLAAQMVRDLAPSLRGRSVVVVADSFFFSKKLLRAIVASGFHYVIAAQANTVLTDGRNLESLGKRQRFRSSCVTLPARRGERQKRFSAALRRLDLRCGGPQAVVFSRPDKKKGARTKYLASDLRGATAAEIVRLYALRWQVELYFRDVKMYLGLDQYRVTAECGPENFVMLVTLTYLFLHWRGDGSRATASTLRCIQDLGHEIAADNVAAIERAAITRHQRGRIKRHFERTSDVGARTSRERKNNVSRLREAS